MAYRHDIDGLRGLAIALVVVFHIWMGRVSGGVDVFLTLSGFFFLGSLLRGAADRRTPLNPLPHLTRLIRRLYPALVVTVAATVVGTVLIKPPTQWTAIFDQTVASLFYFQNWTLALTASDYAAADATISPLQHLWSMSVQGQFYVIALTVVLGVAALWRGGVPRRFPKGLLLAGVGAAAAPPPCRGTTRTRPPACGNCSSADSWPSCWSCSSCPGRCACSPPWRDWR